MHAADRRRGADELADDLAVTLPRLHRLALCRQPRTLADIALIAEVFGIPIVTLAQIAFD